MENMVIQGLDDILKGMEKLKDQYTKLKLRNQELESQNSILKVEAEQYIQENIVLKKEVEEKAIEFEKAKLVPSEQPQTVDIEAIKLDQKQKNAQIQLQLDGFVEEIDQCIQIIQTKE
jgi:hypothetical protein